MIGGDPDWQEHSVKLNRDIANHITFAASNITNLKISNLYSNQPSVGESLLLEVGRSSLAAAPCDSEALREKI